MDRLASSSPGVQVQPCGGGEAQSQAQLHVRRDGEGSPSHPMRIRGAQAGSVGAQYTSVSEALGREVRDRSESGGDCSAAAPATDI